jgi:hypothetical protein
MNWDWNSVLITPVENFFGSVIEYLPKILAVLVLLLLAWILAKVLRKIFRKILQMSTIDKRMGKGGEPVNRDNYPVAYGTGTAVYWIVWILFILAILQVLGLHGVIDSVVVLFEKIFAAVPNILAAIIVLAIFYFVGRFIVRIVVGLLDKARFNQLPVKLGLTKEEMEGKGSPSNIVGYLIMVFIMLFAIMMAADLLGFTVVNDLVAEFTEFLALVIWGLIIVSIGIFVANLVANILRSGGRSDTMISVVRGFIIVLAIAIGLRAMGFANDIILLVFGVMLGAVAVAAAIAFGLGGRKFAAEMLDKWSKPKEEKSTKTEK